MPTRQPWSLGNSQGQQLSKVVCMSSWPTYWSTHNLQTNSMFSHLMWALPDLKPNGQYNPGRQLLGEEEPQITLTQWQQNDTPPPFPPLLVLSPAGCTLYSQLCLESSQINPFPYLGWEGKKKKVCSMPVTGWGLVFGTEVRVSSLYALKWEGFPPLLLAMKWTLKEKKKHWWGVFFHGKPCNVFGTIPYLESRAALRHLGLPGISHTTLAYENLVKCGYVQWTTIS